MEGTAGPLFNSKCPVLRLNGALGDNKKGGEKYR